MNLSRTFAASLLLVIPLILGGCPSGGGGGGSPAPPVETPPPPKIHDLLPANGPMEGGTMVVIRGKDFREESSDPAPIQVWFGQEQATEVLLRSTTELRVVTPPGRPGAVEVRVANSDRQEARLAVAFRYDESLAPRVDSVSPDQGPNYGGENVTITGTNFQPGAEVRFGGALSQRVTVHSPERIEALTPYGPAGTVAVQVKNPDNLVGFMPRAYTFQDHFRIEGVSFVADLDRLNPGRTDHPINVPITVSFNRALDPASVDENTFSLMTRDSKRATGTVVVQGNTVTFQPDVRFVGNDVVFGFNTGYLYVLNIPGVKQGPTVRSLGAQSESLGRGFTWELNTNLDPYDFNQAPPRMYLKVPDLKDPKVDRAKLDTEIVVQFDEVVMPVGVVDPRALIFEVEVSGLPTRIPVDGKRSAGVDPQLSATYLRFVPDRLLPSLSKVWITGDPSLIRDIVGKPLDPETRVLSFLTESGSGYQSAITEEFNDTRNIDWALSGARWGGGTLRPGKLGDSGVLGTLEVLSGTRTLNTDNELIPGSATLTGDQIRVTDGVFRFDRIRVGPGATLRLTGNNPALLLARGGIQIDGKIEANAANPAAHNHLNTTGGSGGAGVLGGGTGGRGGSRQGQGPVDGQDGTDISVPPGHPRAAQGAGTGGKGSRANPAGASVPSVTYNIWDFFSQQVAGGAGGGSYFTRGTQGSSVLPEPQFSGDLGPSGAAGVLFPLLPLDTFTPTSLQLLIGGAGGGGAGVHAADSMKGSPLEWSTGAGGGGGGGALLLQAGGDLNFSATGAIEARGAAGGGPVASGRAAPGGGGAGGTVLFQVQRQATMAGAVNVSGGQGAITAGTYVGTWRSTGGNGGAGYIRLEADPIVPHASLTRFTPAATAENTALLAETNPVTGATSTWFNTHQVTVTWLRVEIKVKEGQNVTTYSDNATAGTLMALGQTPVAFFIQGAVLDQHNQPTSRTSWFPQVASLNTVQPLSLGIRFTVLLDTSKLAPGLDLEVQEVKVLYSL